MLEKIFLRRTISKKDFQFFQRFGFLKIEKFLSDEGINILRKNLSRVIKKAKKQDNQGVIGLDDDGSVKVLIHLDKWDDFFFNFSNDKIFKKISSQLLEKETMPLIVEHFNKSPIHGTKTPFHQDDTYYDFKNAESVAFWIALDDVTLTNGCLEYGKNFVKKRFDHHPSKTKGFGQEINEEFIPKELFKIQIPKGGCIIHHSLAIHGSNSNKSKKKRRALVINYKSK
jgi:ectoine hydroxylase-related dioxygenase (phytanoyl-CoA dioxygenase family)